MRPHDVALCEMLLKAVPNHVTPINDGLRTIQFQSLSADPTDPSGRIFGGTQDNGTWSYDTSRSEANRWFESVGGDGGQSGFDPTGGPIRYHNYFDATPEVNFHGDDPEDLAGDLRPAAAERRGALVLHAVRGRSADAGTRVHGHGPRLADR